MFQHHQFGRPQFAQGATLINSVPMTPHIRPCTTTQHTFYTHRSHTSH